MKKILLPLATVVVLIAIIVIIVLSIADKQHAKVIFQSNTDAKAINITPREYQCSACKMEIEQLPYAVEIVNAKGKTWFFDDMGCAVEWLEHQDFNKDAVIWVTTEDTLRWVNARKACYRRDASTPMGFGFAAQEHCNNHTVDYNTIRLKILRGETMKDPLIRKQLQGHS